MAVNDEAIITEVRKYLLERASMRGLDKEIHSLHVGTDREAVLTVGMVERLLELATNPH